MVKLKCGEPERELVVRAMRDSGIQLQSHGRGKKLFTDDEGVPYCVVVGYEFWHEIPASLLHSKEVQNGQGILLIAIRAGNKLTIYQGSLSDLANQKDRLRFDPPRYHFKVEIARSTMQVKEAPTVILRAMQCVPAT